ncbi:programmed cell death protein 6-like [Oppia nitens]|uniref:programmed cell death protein 6-like n=1 Tax=Oppia nitens TaxID=1686743 RepID=UPI0023DA3D59|nr:programmed cell death protein 6-like [Oppia nitens]
MNPQNVTPDDSLLVQYFQSVDTDRSGIINALELQKALSNGSFEAFDLQTIHLMIAMFDKTKSRSIDLDAFRNLWQYITNWLNCFQSYDLDKSGQIDVRELKHALTSFGYRFSDQFYEKLMTRFEQIIHFDDFIKICIHLQSLTDEFRRLDTDLDGMVTLSYENFVSLVFNSVLSK